MTYIENKLRINFTCPHCGKNDKVTFIKYPWKEKILLRGTKYVCFCQRCGLPFNPFPKRANKTTGFSFLKILLDILLISSFIGLIITGYFTFTHTLPPVTGALSFTIVLIMFICLIFLERGRTLKNRSPSVSLVFWCLVGITLIATFAGVQPLSTYKDHAFNNISEWWESFASKNEVIGPPR